LATTSTDIFPFLLSGIKALYISVLERRVSALSTLFVNAHRIGRRKCDDERTDNTGCEEGDYTLLPYFDNLLNDISRVESDLSLFIAKEEKESVIKYRHRLEFQ
jgi:hypothetical protein